MRMQIRADDWRLREAPFAYQQTFITPLGNRAIPEERSNLERFVKALFAPFDVSDCEVRIELFVFEPTNLIWYLRGSGISTDEGKLYDGQLNSATLVAESKTEAYALLECVLGQWADFAMFTSGNDFAIYSDHDEFTTIFTAGEAALTSIRAAVQAAGFKEVEDWVWTGPHSPGKIEVGTNV